MRRAIAGSLLVLCTCFACQLLPPPPPNISRARLSDTATDPLQDAAKIGGCTHIQRQGAMPAGVAHTSVPWSSTICHSACCCTPVTAVSLIASPSHVCAPWTLLSTTETRERIRCPQPPPPQSLRFEWQPWVSGDTPHITVPVTTMPRMHVAMRACPSLHLSSPL